LLYFGSIISKPIHLNVSEVTLEFEGRKVTTSGIITNVYINEEKQFISLTISDGKSYIQVPIFSDLTNALKQRGIEPKMFKEGLRVEVTGAVGQYKGRIQVIPRKVEDIRLKE
ncbi:MAG: hypothetical protein J7L39_03790, partial [Candidatus Aenigmarchaeota archaeon]|nr:hypothetical protein [Candidatus Aenigmarchaeota archaeon]